jgi:Methyltransferase domain
MTEQERPPVLAQRTFKQNEAALQALDLAGKFQFIHRNNMWGSPESVSGVGSTIDATAPVRRGIGAVSEQYGIKSLLDAPCGDCSWITASDLSVEKYVGVDIVPELVERNRVLHNSAAFEFRVADLTHDQLPQCDLIFCRDCLVHLSFKNIAMVLRNFHRSGAHFLLTTTFPEHEINRDIADGDWRLLNLCNPPFLFPRPLLTINEECEEIGGAYRDKSLALWEIASLPL